MEKEIKPLPHTNYDSEFCGSIPIQLINLIQPHGLLFLLNKSFRIEQVSENVKQMLGIGASEIAGKELSAFITQEQLEGLQHKIEGRKSLRHIPHIMRFNVQGTHKRFVCAIHIHPEYFILEMEPLEEASSDITFISAYQDIKYITGALQEAEDIRHMSTMAVREIRQFSGFDKVMIYRFDEQWNGTVIAEALDDGMEPYLGLTFPASDVPKQARELYFKNPYRLIPVINFQPVRLYPVVNPVIGGFTDLSECSLRSVPQVHVEYLNNMGVQASMSTPIIVDGKLWGLISCHHKNAKWISFETRYAFEVLSELISSQIAARQRADRIARMKDKRAKELKVMDHIYRKEDLFMMLQEEGEELLNLLEAGGASLLLEDHLESIGTTPNDSQVKEMVKWLKLYKKEKLFATHSLSQHFGKAAAYVQKASGLLALQFSHSPVSYLLVYRPEIIQTVNWGGNPNEAIQFEKDQQKYHPRNSFKKWKEEVRDTSLPWEPEVLDVARNLRSVLVERILMDLQE